MGLFSRKKKETKELQRSNYTKHDTLRLFYCDYEKDEDIPSENALQCKEEEALDYMRNLSGADGNFLGIILPDEKTVQFMQQEGGSVYIDIPAMEMGGAYTKETSLEEVLKVISEVYGGMDPLDIEGTAFNEY